MYKNLSCDYLSITGRQSEIIELALTYGFQGIDIDMDDLAKRCERTSFESASRFLLSSKLNAAGFVAPVDLDCDDEQFAKALASLDNIAEIAKQCGGPVAIVKVPAATDRLPYPEYFEVVRKRVSEIAAKFEEREVKVALAFSPQDASADDKQFKFVADTEGFCALVRAMTAKNVGIVFDSWDWHLGGGTVDTLKELGAEKVLSVVLGDCKEGVEAAAATNDDCLLPGSTGVIDNTGYLTAIASTGASLPVAARGMPAEGKATRDALISKAQDGLDQCLTQSGLETETRKPEDFVAPSYSRSAD